MRHPVRRGQIWRVAWEPGRGSEQHGRRPALIVQSNLANELEHYGLTIVVAISSGGHEDNALHIPIEPSRMNGLDRRSFVRCEQVLTISKGRLDGHIGQLEKHLLKQVDANLRDMLDL